MTLRTRCLSLYYKKVDLSVFRPSMDDALVLKQELVQVQMLMDQMARDRERETEQLQTDKARLQTDYDKLQTENTKLLQELDQLVVLSLGSITLVFDFSLI